MGGAALLPLIPNGGDVTIRSEPRSLCFLSLGVSSSQSTQSFSWVLSVYWSSNMALSAPLMSYCSDQWPVRRLFAGPASVRTLGLLPFLTNCYGMVDF